MLCASVPRAARLGRSWASGIAFLASACLHAAPPAVGLPDQPVPLTEARSTVAFVVELRPGAACEEEFDLQLYENRAVDLIVWDANEGECRGRRVEVRYLSNRIGREALLREVERYALRA